MIKCKSTATGEQKFAVAVGPRRDLRPFAAFHAVTGSGMRHALTMSAMSSILPSQSPA